LLDAGLVLTFAQDVSTGVMALLVKFCLNLALDWLVTSVALALLESCRTREKFLLESLDSVQTRLNAKRARRAKRPEVAVENKF